MKRLDFEGATGGSGLIAAHDPFYDSPLELRLLSLLDAEELSIRQRARAHLASLGATAIVGHWEMATFPSFLLRALSSSGLVAEASACSSSRICCSALVLCEVSRFDGSLSTFFLVHTFGAMLTISKLGSEVQKQEFLGPLGRLQQIGCFALTEPGHGSDVSTMETAATKVAGGWLINGHKRWIGNGTWADVVVVWARSSMTNQVNAFIVRKGNPGLSVSKIGNKISLRSVQNADMTFMDCFVPDSDRLPGVKTWADASDVLGLSRVLVSWQPVGLCMGVYDECFSWLRGCGPEVRRSQGAQEKLQRILAHTQAMWLLCWHVTKLCEKGQMSHHQASLAKAWSTLRARQVVALARELLGEQALDASSKAARAFSDVEAFYSYEGTYEVNALVVGRAITGLSAFKAPQPKM